MLFEYPYKLYRIGFDIFLGVRANAVYFSVTLEMATIFRVLFIGIILLLVRSVRKYYESNYERFKSYNITVSPEQLNILFENESYTFMHDQIRIIYYAKQVEKYKLYHVIHIFTIENQYFYFSNELIKFHILLQLLEDQYYDKFRKIDHLLKDFKWKDEGDLFLEYLHNDKS